MSSELQIFGKICHSVTKLCPTLCDLMDCSMSGFPVHHQLSELVQTYVHGVDDAIQPSQPLLSPSYHPVRMDIIKKYPK